MNPATPTAAATIEAIRELLTDTPDWGPDTLDQIAYLVNRCGTEPGQED